MCMATYNGEKYIMQQINSILYQLGAEDELIISDDMSSDKTISLINSFQDSRVKIYMHESNHGFVHNFENALSYAKGDIIFLSDQDDEWMPNKVEETLKALKDVDFVVSDCITVDQNNRILSISRIEDFNIKTGFWNLMFRTRYLGCCMAFKKRVLEAALPFPPNAFLVEHDLWIAAVAERYFKTALIYKPLIRYRRHGGNVSSGGMGKGGSMPNKVYRRIYRLIYLTIIRKRVAQIIRSEE